jgi:hypothetical protein
MYSSTFLLKFRLQNLQRGANKKESGLAHSCQELATLAPLLKVDGNEK